MKFGTDGRLYCTVYGQGDVTVLRSGRLRFGTHRDAWRLPTNIAFAPAGGFAVITEVAGVGGRAHACILRGRSASLSGLSDLSADRIHCG